VALRGHVAIGVTRLATGVGLLAALLAGSSVHAQSLPVLDAPVNDFAHVLDPDSARTLDTRIRALHAATGDVVVVATVPSYAPYGSIEEYAVRLFENAGIGQRASDNGVLMVVALQERRVRIEVGYGLEEFITDGFAGETIRREILPAFRDGAYGAGILQGTTRIIQRIAERRGVTLSDLPPPVPDAGSGDEMLVGAIIALIVIVLVLSRVFRRRGGPPFGGFPRRSPWSGWSSGIGGFGAFGGFGGGRGGGHGGGFGGFGGGRSGGGGASGGW
jgi:uncharacterized protein